jgi:hypothetical protein
MILYSVLEMETKEDKARLDQNQLSQPPYRDHSKEDKSRFDQNRLSQPPYPDHFKEDKSRLNQNRLMGFLYPDHSPFEIWIWIAAWSFALGYGIYKTYLASQGNLT